MGSKTAVFCSFSQKSGKIPLEFLKGFVAFLRKIAVFAPIFGFQLAVENFLHVVWPCYRYEKVFLGVALQEKINFKSIRFVDKKILQDQKKFTL